MDPEFNLQDEKEAEFIENKAISTQAEMSRETLPSRMYLEKTTIPFINEALQVLAKERPVNPVEFFSYYLLTHNPYKDGEVYKEAFRAAQDLLEKQKQQELLEEQQEEENGDQQQQQQQIDLPSQQNI
ncbi:hypothetical protein PPERSA_09728 [Pseudocohnilembus persalinus]|uniref:Dpy-30 motif n=1 Tax=Pseudocohnilembus persalinus TaxID=266149 RepID=A0A0V0QV63_PSEPJ|nr:hypothetical protein PPERSA_09728 [Pseudocohnilembus persalinus]|eukprot:KRX06116.1 hypothetical protein PPERSA_09728 [Pseudocohnilembus persalinus]